MTKPLPPEQRKQYDYRKKWPQLYAQNLNGMSWSEVAESIGVSTKTLLAAKRRHEAKLGNLVTDPVEHRRQLIGAGWHALTQAVAKGDARGAAALMRELSRLGGANAEVGSETGATALMTGPVQIVIAPSERALPQPDMGMVVETTAAAPFEIAPAEGNRLPGETVYSGDDDGNRLSGETVYEVDE